MPKLFGDVWTPAAVVAELQDGAKKGYDVPETASLTWLRVTDPRSTPSEWLALDLGAGELAALALALENRERIVLLDDGRARRTAQAAGLTVWGTLRVLLEAKRAGLTHRVAPFVDRLEKSGLWISTEIRQRILALAGED